MNRTGLLNLLAVAGAVAASVALAAPPSIVDPSHPSGRDHHERGYRRIVSASTVADRLLVELCEPERVLAFTKASAAGIDGHRYVGRARIEQIDDVEQIVAMQPDVLIVHNVGDVRRVERLREAGLHVLDLGAPQGLRSLPDEARRIGALCGGSERADVYVRTIDRRLRAIARHLRERKRGMYVTIYSGQLFGGTIGSTYHEVLTYAGVNDAAAERYRGWPQYSHEQLLAIDPEILVTRNGMRSALCTRAGLETLRACRRGAVYEVDGALLDAPGPGILDAAEAVHAAAYGE